MKATLDLPDDLYRRIKARSALEGRPVRAVALQLFQNWLEAPPTPVSSGMPLPATSKRPPSRFDNAPWLAIAANYIKPGMSHDMVAIRQAIAKGSAAETAEKRIPGKP